MNLHFSNIQGCDPLVPRGCEPKAGIANLNNQKKGNTDCSILPLKTIMKL